MGKSAKHEAAIPNPALKPLSVLVGEWNTVGAHPALPGTLHGHASVEWLEGGAFLIMHSAIDEPGVPTSISIFGCDDAEQGYFDLYFDERGVSRLYKMTLNDKVWTLWRDDPSFRQRFTGTISEDGNTIIGVWELAKDGSSWARDLELTYRRQFDADGEPP